MGKMKDIAIDQMNAELKPRQALWLHSSFVVGDGWQQARFNQVEVVGETDSCYKLMRQFLFLKIYNWVFKDSIYDRVEFLK